jgi:hypothetical protein
MTTYQIGSPVDDYELFLRRKGMQGFVIEFYSDTARTILQTGIDGLEMRVLVGDRSAPVKTWTAIVAGSKATYNLTETDTDVTFNQYDGLLLQVAPGGETPIANLSITFDPS